MLQRVLCCRQVTSYPSSCSVVWMSAVSRVSCFCGGTLGSSVWAADLTEVRAERDVLQTRMSEQALKISSLSARLETQRNNAEALAHQAASQLTVSLHDALAEVQRLKEELESKDKQLLRAKQNLEEKEKLSEQHQTLYGNSCNPKDKVIILERELSSAQTRIAQLEALARTLKLDDDDKDDKTEPDGKTSARTLSDIVSISEFDEQDLQMRRAELKAHNLSLNAPYVDNRDKTQLNRTLPPNLSKPNMSSLNIDFIDQFDLPSFTPRGDSLPIHLTSTQNKDAHGIFKRNVNETTVFGTLDKFGEGVKHSTAQKIPDNCSMFPNRDVDESKDVSVEPKKINFSIEPSNDNRTQDEEFTSLRELGITLDIRQENFPDILTQLKHEIKKSKRELESCKSELKNAEEQLCEFPALKEEVEELKGLLENTMATMENDKKFYENQLEHFSSNKTLLEQRVSELTQEVNEKSKDLHLFKEDILRRENMILELAKEKRNLTNKMTELECKIDEIQSRNTALEKCETDNRILKEKVSELQKLEQLVSEKNQQIDSLNQHLDRLDDLQRCLNDKTEELDHLKEAFEEKSNELFRIQRTIDAQNRDIEKINEDNNNLNVANKELKLKLTKLEKEQENASLKLQNSESELERVNSLNNELTSKIDELKDLTDKLKDKETEIDILNEDINSYHEEIASLKEQMKMVSRSPSPKSKGEKPDRQASNDKKQLVKIRKQISLLQHELDFNRKELNDKLEEKTERCQELEAELQDMKDLVEKMGPSRQSPSSQRALVVSGARSPTAELERALRDQLDYSHHSNMIQILKKRLESAMQSELELQQRELQHKARLAALERQLVPSGGHDEPTKQLLQHELENSERLRGEISLLKSKLEVERTRSGDAQATLDHARAHHQRELDAKSDACHALRGELAELKSELARELTTLRSLVTSPELATLRDARTQLGQQVESLQAELRTKAQAQEEKDQAIRYLHNRCLKLESCRKALVWQKRYLQRVLAGYAQLEKSLLPEAREPARPTGKKRFKCAALAVVSLLRMGFLVRRRLAARALPAAAVLRPRTEHTPYVH
ncbi:hypothetical protein MSG28_013428 [Choristoneura fumiferana]|uniref:Uncharacterized protein n=1 Tax=Choristoneura fumiferana TaxID=7141 RepID=A0ACC0KTV5_CHOFU|nr:hypothetical protein MSG28_013428 [Choristoneura fumiferana]